jgi:hypothetical protein
MRHALLGYFDEGLEMPTEQSKNMSIQGSDGSKIDEPHVQ